MNIEKDVERYSQAVDTGYSVGEEKVGRQINCDFYKMEEICMAKIKVKMWKLIQSYSYNTIINRKN